MLAIAAAAHISVPVPGSDVPQSLQTLAVLVAGALLGGRDGTIALGAYLALGALGAPIFADGAAGASHLFGPTAGYLAGFVVAAAGIGRLAERGRLDRFPEATAWMIAGHAVILGLGGAWLAARIGPGAALETGVAPFLWGGVAKSLAAAALVIAWKRAVARRQREGRSPADGQYGR